MADNAERNAEILRRLEDKRPFEVARDMGVSYATVAGVLRRQRNKAATGSDEEWTEVDAWPDPPLTSAGRLAALHEMMNTVLGLKRDVSHNQATG